MGECLRGCVNRVSCVLYSTVKQTGAGSLATCTNFVQPALLRVAPVATQGVVVLSIIPFFLTTTCDGTSIIYTRAKHAPRSSPLTSLTDIGANDMYLRRFGI